MQAWTKHKKLNGPSITHNGTNLTKHISPAQPGCQDNQGTHHALSNVPWLTKE